MKPLKMFVDEFERNSKATLGSPRARLTRFLNAISDVTDGQTFVITYLPGKGTTLRTPNGAQVTVPGKDFADAMLRVWLGNDPLDPEPKSRLLRAK